MLKRVAVVWKWAKLNERATWHQIIFPAIALFVAWNVLVVQRQKIESIGEVTMKLEKQQLELKEHDAGLSATADVLKVQQDQVNVALRALVDSYRCQQDHSEDSVVSFNIAEQLANSYHHRLAVSLIQLASLQQKLPTITPDERAWLAKTVEILTIQRQILDARRHDAAAFDKKRSEDQKAFQNDLQKTANDLNAESELRKKYAERRKIELTKYGSQLLGQQDLHGKLATLEAEADSIVLKIQGKTN